MVIVTFFIRFLLRYFANKKPGLENGISVYGNSAAILQLGRKRRGEMERDIAARSLGTETAKGRAVQLGRKIIGRKKRYPDYFPARWILILVFLDVFSDDASHDASERMLSVSLIGFLKKGCVKWKI